MKTSGPNCIEVATTFNNIGSLYVSKVDYQKALENMNKCL